MVIVSEKEKETAPTTQSVDNYWLVDPPDGTENLLAVTGEFTINIALVEEWGPTLGEVLAPAKSDTFWGCAVQVL